MITDKDSEELRELTRQIRSTKMDVVFFDYGWNECAEIIMRYVNKKCTESAEQARKDEADRAVAFLKKEWYWFNDDACYADELLDAILGDSVVKENLITDYIPDTVEKLAIAVKALEKINERHSFADIVDDSYIISRDALREIQ